MYGMAKCLGSETQGKYNYLYHFLTAAALATGKYCSLHSKRHRGKKKIKWKETKRKTGTREKKKKRKKEMKKQVEKRHEVQVDTV